MISLVVNRNLVFNSHLLGFYHVFGAAAKTPCSSPSLWRSLWFPLASLQGWIVCAERLRSLAACASGIWPNRGSEKTGGLQTSLSCQLTPFPRVLGCKRPSESISANTQGGETGKMFRFMYGGQTLTEKQLESHIETFAIMLPTH